MASTSSHPIPAPPGAPSQPGGRQETVWVHAERQGVACTCFACANTAKKAGCGRYMHRRVRTHREAGCGLRMFYMCKHSQTAGCGLRMLCMCEHSPEAGRDLRMLCAHAAGRRRRQGPMVIGALGSRQHVPRHTCAGLTVSPNLSKFASLNTYTLVLTNTLSFIEVQVKRHALAHLL